MNTIRNFISHRSMPIAVLFVAACLASPSAMRSQTIDNCSSGVVDSENGVEQTVCIYGDASSLTASGEVDAGVEGYSEDYDTYADAVGIDAQLYDGSNLIWDSGDQHSYLDGTYSEVTVEDEITPNSGDTYYLNTTYDEDICETGDPSCDYDGWWDDGNSGLSTQATVASATPTIASSSMSYAPAGSQGTFAVSGTDLVDPSGRITVSITGGITASVATATSARAVINFSIPATLSPGTQSVTISNSYGTSAPSTFSVAAAGPVSTTTVLTSSPNPSVFDQSVILSATVTAAGGASPNGTVEFFDGATNIGSFNILYGNAALTVSNFSIGTHTLTAEYLGNSSFNPSTSAPVSQVVQPIPTTTTITLTPATSYFNSTVGVAIQVSDTVGVYPTGSIYCNATGTTWTFSGPLTNGAASSALNNLPVGSYSIGCSYSASADFGASVASATETVLPDTPTWTNSGNMQQTLFGHTATLLSNGTVLIAGGNFNGNGDQGAVSAAEIYTPTGGDQGVFSPTGGLQTARYWHTATLLTTGPNAGQVLVVGGENYQDTQLQEAELYNPANGGSFSVPSPQPNYPRSMHTAIQLQDGTILIAGGDMGCVGCGAWDLAPAEVYKPVTGAFSTVGSLNTPRTEHTATLLQNGMVLIAGGRDSSNNVTASAELYNPSTGTFTPTGSLNTARAYHTATLLPNGEVLIAGGYDNNGNPTISAELYNAALGTFSTTGNLLTARAGAGAALLNDGKVLIYGGCTNYDCSPSATTAAELYSSASGTFASTTTLNSPRAFSTTVELGYGVVLATGGADPLLASVETFDNHEGVTGAINPKYMIMGITYAPPGQASTVTYTDTNFVGNTATLSNSFQNTTSIETSLTASGSSTAGGSVCCKWASLSASGSTTSGISWQQTTTNQYAITVTGQTSTNWKTPGTNNYFSPVNHDYDIIWVWLNPVIVLTVDSSNPSALPVWNGYGYDTTDPANGVEVVGVPVGCLNGDNPPGTNCSQYSYPLSRSWVNNQTYPNGDVPALTPTDYANILKADPFTNPSYTVIDGPGPPTGATTADGRFTHATTPGGSTNEIMYYFQESPQWQDTYTYVYSNSTTASQSAENKTTISWGISDSLAGSFFGVEITYKATYSGSVALDNKTETSITNTTTNSASATVYGPTCTGSPCNPLYSGVPPAQPGEFDVYQDNLYGSFMFWGVY